MKILGIDYGLHKIGLALAVSDLIQPLEIIHNKPGHLLEQQALEKIKFFIKQENVETVVIGNPYLRGHYSDNSKYFDVFIKMLRNLVSKLGVQLVEIDEYKTSEISQNEMNKIGIKKKDIKNDDAFSAGLLIQRYLEEQV